MSREIRWVVMLIEFTNWNMYVEVSFFFILFMVGGMIGVIRILIKICMKIFSVIRMSDIARLMISFEWWVSSWGMCAVVVIDKMFIVSVRKYRIKVMMFFGWLKMSFVFSWMFCGCRFVYVVELMMLRNLV